MEKKSRRKFLLGAAGVLGGSLLTAWIFRRNILMNTIFKTTVNPAILASPAPSLDTDVCVLTSRQPEGPLYIPSPERSNIIEDRVGKELDLRIQVLRYPDCTPIENAVVEIWQGDAEGKYSGYPVEVTIDAWETLMQVITNGEKRGDEFNIKPTEEGTFLRGLQRTDKNGWVSFNTIFPAWYTFRIPHIHFKVFVGKKELLTSQFYFDKEIEDRVFTTLDPYKKMGVCPNTVQSDFAVAQKPGNVDGLMLKPIWSDDSPLTATAKIGVKQA
ncbi:MAG TPA: hypothetical protein VK154_15635 [Chitinophagales bacterium]|nr:hypothetical protein [Chitinophagales bacterium]